MISYTANNYGTPTIHLPGSPFRAQETDQIVIRAEIISPTAHAFGSWHHGNISYSHHIYEDPFCNPDVEVSIVLYIFIVQFPNISLENIMKYMNTVKSPNNGHFGTRPTKI